MVTVAVFSSPNTDDGPDAVPRRIFEEAPDVEIELESLVPLGGRAIPYIWVWGEELGSFERALDAFSEIGDAAVVETVGGGALYRVEWTVDSPIIECIASAGGTLVDAHGTAERWSLKTWFERGSDARAFQRCCRERGIPLEVERIGTTTGARGNGDSPVTERQLEALRTAYAKGYFERPRGSTQQEIADELGISAAATGNRLRRGTANLVESFLDDP